jgi:SAM-dependent methyltransferase
MPVRDFDTNDPTRVALRADATAVCATRLARVAGTHALLLDTCGAGAPVLPGVANWTMLQPAPHGSGWRGPLRADTSPLPFGDDSFCAVLVRFIGAAGVAPEAVAGELSRVLAPHGVLLVADMHPRSLWRSDSAPPGHWERALRAVDLKVGPATRCGAPWPRAQGADGVPHWLVRGLGGAYVIEARRRTLAAIPMRKATARRHAVEHNLLPGARRQCA